MGIDLINSYGQSPGEPDALVRGGGRETGPRRATNPLSTDRLARRAWTGGGGPAGRNGGRATEGRSTARRVTAAGRAATGPAARAAGGRSVPGTDLGSRAPARAGPTGAAVRPGATSAASAPGTRVRARTAPITAASAGTPPTTGGQGRGGRGMTDLGRGDPSTPALAMIGPGRTAPVRTIRGGTGRGRGDGGPATRALAAARQGRGRRNPGNRRSPGSRPSGPRGARARSASTGICA